MYVCICHAVTDTDIVSAVENGACDLSSLAERLGAGTGCGTCQEFTQQLIDNTLASNLAEKLGYAA